MAVPVRRPRGPLPGGASSPGLLLDLFFFHSFPFLLDTRIRFASPFYVVHLDFAVLNSPSGFLLPLGLACQSFLPAGFYSCFRSLSMRGILCQFFSLPGFLSNSSSVGTKVRFVFLSFAHAISGFRARTERKQVGGDDRRRLGLGASGVQSLCQRTPGRETRLFSRLFFQKKAGYVTFEGQECIFPGLKERCFRPFGAEDSPPPSRREYLVIFIT